MVTIALLKYLVEERGIPLLDVYLAYDCDGPGAKAFQNNVGHLLRGTGIEVRPVHGLLPDEIQRVLPPYDPKLYGDGGPCEGVRVDLNDVLRSPEFSHYAHQSGYLGIREMQLGNWRGN